MTEKYGNSFIIWTLTVWSQY